MMVIYYYFIVQRLEIWNKLDENTHQDNIMNKRAASALKKHKLSYYCKQSVLVEKFDSEENWSEQVSNGTSKFTWSTFYWK